MTKHSVESKPESCLIMNDSLDNLCWCCCSPQQGTLHRAGQTLQTRWLRSRPRQSPLSARPAPLLSAWTPSPWHNLRWEYGITSFLQGNTSSPPRYHQPEGSLVSSRQTIGNSWKGLWCRPPEILMFRWFSGGDEGLTSRQVASWTSSKSTSAQGSAPLPAMTTTQPNLPPSYSNPERWRGFFKTRRLPHLLACHKRL